MESLRHILALKNLRAYIHVSRFQSQLPFLYSLFSYSLKVVESLLTIACLVPPGLRHAPHPFKLSPVEVVGPGYLGPLVVYSLLAFFQIVAVVAAVGVYRVVVKLQDDVAHAVEEEAVVGDHKQRFVAPVQVALQPFYHFEVEMVGRLIQYQQVGVGDKHICQRHPFLLSSRQLSHRLLKVADVQLRKYLLRLKHPFRVAMMVEAGIEHGLVFVKQRRLLQVSRAKVVAVDDLARVVALFTSNHRQQGRLARTVLGNESYLLSCRY